jgi:hypothetical protein
VFHHKKRKRFTEAKNRVFFSPHSNQRFSLDNTHFCGHYKAVSAPSSRAKQGISVGKSNHMRTTRVCRRWRHSARSLGYLPIYIYTRAPDRRKFVEEGVRKGTRHQAKKLPRIPCYMQGHAKAPFALRMVLTNLQNRDGAAAVFTRFLHKCACCGNGVCIYTHTPQQKRSVNEERLKRFPLDIYT